MVAIYASLGQCMCLNWSWYQVVNLETGADIFKFLYRWKCHQNSFRVFITNARTTYFPSHYEIMTLKITLIIFVTLKRHGNHTEKYLQGNHSDNSGLSYWNIFLCCSRTLKSHWKVLNHTNKFSALLISIVPRFCSVTLDFQCDFQCHNFIVSTALPLFIYCCHKPGTKSRNGFNTFVPIRV